MCFLTFRCECVLLDKNIVTRALFQYLNSSYTHSTYALRLSCTLISRWFYLHTNRLIFDFVAVRFRIFCQPLNRQYLESEVVTNVSKEFISVIQNRSWARDAYPHASSVSLHKLVHLIHVSSHIYDVCTAPCVHTPSATWLFTSFSCLKAFRIFVTHQFWGTAPCFVFLAMFCCITHTRTRCMCIAC